MRFLKKFLPDQNNRALFPGFVAFCVAALGAALGFTANAISVHWLSIVAFCVTALGVFGGAIFILHRWWLLFRAAIIKEEKK